MAASEKVKSVELDILFKDKTKATGRIEGKTLEIRYESGYQKHLYFTHCHSRGVIAIIPKEGFKEENYMAITRFCKQGGLMNCVRCGHIWMKRSESPRHCPHCGSSNFDFPRFAVTVGKKPNKDYWKKERKE